MSLLNDRQTNRILGYPPDARLLILNADDFGMCYAVSAAIVHVLEAGMVRSTTLLVPYAQRFAGDTPIISSRSLISAMWVMS